MLDEPNSNLDTAGEAALIDALRTLQLNRVPTVVVTHRLNLLAAAQKILVMSAGTVQAIGDRDRILEGLLGPQNPDLQKIRALRRVATTALEAAD